MKKFFQLMGYLLIIGFIYLAMAGTKLQQVNTEIDISAPPEKVWGIITDINEWQNWSPIINTSQGDAKMDSTLSITMMSNEKGRDGPKYSPIIIELKEPNYFHWRAHMLAGFFFTNDKIFKLEKTETGTHLTHSETFKGLMAPIMTAQIEKNIPAMLDSMNQALKEMAEKE